MDSPQHVRRSVCELRPGDHAWLGYTDPCEQRTVTRAFLGAGLAAGDKVICLAGPPHAPGTGAYLPCRAEQARAGRRLAVVSMPECAGREPTDPYPVVAALAEQITRAEHDGYSTIRVTADMTWAACRPGGLEPLLACERHVDEAVGQSSAVIVVCQIDRRACENAQLNALQGLHGVLATADPLFRDPVLRIEQTFLPPGLALAGELDQARHGVFGDALRAVLARAKGRQVHLDLAGLSFIDLGAVMLLTEAAKRRVGTAPLVLDGMSAQLRGVMEHVGWEMFPGLRLGHPR